MLWGVFIINGHSMQPTYSDGNYLMVNKLTYLVSPPQFWDIVVIAPEVGVTRSKYVKRIIGLPGDTLRFESGAVMRKNAWESEFRILNEPYLTTINQNNTYLPMYLTDEWEIEYVVPAWAYWVMGDNRQNSADSRHCFQNCFWVDQNKHFIGLSQIVGKVISW